MAVMLGACSVLQRMLRRNPLAALSLQQPSMRTPSLRLPDDMPFELDKEGEAESPDGVCMHSYPHPPSHPKTPPQGVGIQCSSSYCSSAHVTLRFGCSSSEACCKPTKHPPCSIVIAKLCAVFCMCSSTLV